MKTVQRSASLTGVLGREGDFLKFPDNIDAIFVGQFMQKTAGAGGADLVHVKIKGIGVDDGDIFGILTADLKNGVHFRIDLHRPSGMGRDFIDDQIHIQKIPHHIPAGTGGGGPCDFDAFSPTSVCRDREKPWVTSIGLPWVGT